MTNKDYKQLYLESQKENTKLKLELENKIALIDYIYEELDVLSNKIDKIYNEVDALHYTKKEIFTKIKEFSESIDMELEDKLNKTK